MNMLLMDSLPILLAKASRSGNAKVARELCAKTYNASRKQWYYGVKREEACQAVIVAGSAIFFGYVSWFIANIVDVVERSSSPCYSFFLASLLYSRVSVFSPAMPST